MDNSNDLESLLAHLGDFGKYQFIQFLLHLAAAVTAGIHMLSLTTVGAIPKHRCLVPALDYSLNVTKFEKLENFIPKLENGEFDSCHMYNLNDSSIVQCNSWIYNTTYYKSSRGMEWNTVCDRRWMGAVAQSAFMFGVFIGAITLGSTADKYGRKIVFCVSALLQLVFGIAAAFVTSFYSFLIIQIFYGTFGSAGSYMAGFVMSMELVGASKRTICGVSFQASFAVGVIIVAAWAWLIPDRQILQLLYGLHGLLLIGHWWFLDESPRWLYANGKIIEAVKIVQKGLKINGSSVVLNSSDYVLIKANNNTPKVSISDLFKTPVLRKRTLNICLAWFANSIVYYGLSLGTDNLNGNPFLLLCLVSVVELPGYMLIMLLMDRMGRRSLTSLFMVLGGICCIIAAYLFKANILNTIFIMIGKFSISSSFAIIYNYSAELFPTVVRNSALGLGAMSARLSGTLTPLIFLLDSLNTALPTTIFAVTSIISGLAILILPETLGSAMPQTLQDGEMFKIDDNCFISWFGKKDNRNVTLNEQMEPLKSV
ncbi:hypothetical protein FQA39_LY09689 [Lamprigera yunnana]|nr:hypothetical protein FQA39_LY09689 [Lamprigera yunnana]